MDHRHAGTEATPATPSPPRTRFRRVDADVVRERETFAQDVRSGLTSAPKHLSCRYFYDTTGSELFERICELPEYYLTRAAHEILAAHAADLVALVPDDVVLVELGSGSALKTRLIIDALLARHG